VDEDDLHALFVGQFAHLFTRPSQSAR
jgi:hypothetical protein